MLLLVIISVCQSAAPPANSGSTTVKAFVPTVSDMAIRRDYRFPVGKKMPSPIEDVTLVEEQSAIAGRCARINEADVTTASTVVGGPANSSVATVVPYNDFAVSILDACSSTVLSAHS